MLSSLRSLPSIPSRSKRRRPATRGFSLVEMLVAVAIVGLLIGLVGPAAMNQLQSSRVKTTEAQMAQVLAAIDIYQIDTGQVPGKDAGLRALIENTQQVSGWNGPYLRSGDVPTDAWGAEFIYEVQGNTVGLVSLGADGQPGGTGNAADLSR